MMFYQKYLFSFFLIGASLCTAQVGFATKLTGKESAKEMAVAINQDLMKMKSVLGDPQFEREISQIYENSSFQAIPARKRLETILQMYAFLNTFSKKEIEKENDLRVKINRLIKVIIQIEPKSFAELLLERIKAHLAHDPHPPLEISFLLINYNKDLQEAVLLHLERELQKPEYKLYVNYSNEIRKLLESMDKKEPYSWNSVLY